VLIFCKRLRVYASYIQLQDRTEMRKIKNLFIVLLFGATVNSCTSPFADMCGNNISKEINSPDKKLKAVIFIRDCGATTGFSSQLSIIDFSDKLENESGNVLIISDKEYGENGNADLNAEWNGVNELIIYFNLKAITFKKETEIDDIKITYKQLSK
jgi:hypothetical protein